MVMLNLDLYSRLRQFKNLFGLVAKERLNLLKATCIVVLELLRREW